MFNSDQEFGCCVCKAGESGKLCNTKDDSKFCENLFGKNSIWDESDMKCICQTGKDATSNAKFAWGPEPQGIVKDDKACSQR